MARGTGRDKRSRRASARRTRLRIYLVAIGAAAVVVAALIVAGAFSRGGDGGGGDGGPVVLPSPRPADTPREGHVLGSADAPVTVIEYADFQ